VLWTHLTEYYAKEENKRKVINYCDNLIISYEINRKFPFVTSVQELVSNLVLPALETRREGASAVEQEPSFKKRKKRPDKMLKRIRTGKPGLVGVGPICSAVAYMASTAYNSLIGVETRITNKLKYYLDVNSVAWKHFQTTYKKLYPVTCNSIGKFQYHGKDNKARDKINKITVLDNESYAKRIKVGRKKKAFIRATEEVKTSWWLMKWTWGGFVKSEKVLKYLFWAIEFVKPRIISGVAPIIKVLFGSLFLSYQVALKACMHVESDIWFNSGARVEKFTAWYEYHRVKYDNPYYLFSDFSSFDRTQGFEMLEFELNYIDEHFGTYFVGGEWFNRRQCRRFWRLHRKAMLHSKIRFGDWLSVITCGVRKSGNLRTSSGNTLVLATTVASFLDYHGLSYSMAVQGDDNFTILELKEVNEKFTSKGKNIADELKAWCASLGFIAKVKCTDVLSRAELLSMKFYTIGNSVVVGRKPGRVIARLGFMKHKMGFKDEDYKASFKGTLLSILPLANHVPFLRVYVRLCLKELENVTAVFEEDDRDWRVKCEGAQLHEADDGTWAEFIKAYPGMNREVEKNFAKMLAEGFSKYGLSFQFNHTVVEYLLSCEADV